MTKQSIGVVGQGFVGSAIANVFSEHFAVNRYDKDPLKPSTHKDIESLARDSRIIFVCVPTPMKKDGSCSTRIVESVIDQIKKAGRNNIVIVKSTVPMGTTDTFNKFADEGSGIRVIFSPEFLTEVNAEESLRNTDRIILTGDREATARVVPYYKRVFPNAAIYRYADAAAGELCKYFVNCFLAAKVSIANEFYLLAQALGLEYDHVRQLLLTDKRIGTSHLTVPGLDGKFGFSGSCFPKDINSIIDIADSLGIEMNTLKGAWKTNLEVRPDKDWEQLKGRAVVDE